MLCPGGPGIQLLCVGFYHVVKVIEIDIVDMFCSYGFYHVIKVKVLSSQKCVRKDALNQYKEN